MFYRVVWNSGGAHADRNCTTTTKKGRYVNNKSTCEWIMENSKYDAMIPTGCSITNIIELAKEEIEQFNEEEGVS